jgi:oligopeptide/dipeptide ABC transporter ATP-binding protein
MRQLTDEASVLAGTAPLLAVEDLRVAIALAGGAFAEAVAGVSLTLDRGERVGVVGESGSGKTMLGLSILGLLPPVARVTGGSIRLRGRVLDNLSEPQLCLLRGRELAMVFQDPMSGLNPLRTVGSLLVEAARRGGLERREARARAVTMLSLAGIPAAAERMASYPHQLSGGLRQRVMIALALINEPAVLVADEPTTALDTTIQAQILELFRNVSDRQALVLITHDLGVAAEVCDRLIVMYAGCILEEGPTQAVLDSPQHPYTQGLLACRPGMAGAGPRLRPLTGTPPRLGSIPDGCVFAPRCPRSAPECAQRPALAGSADRQVSCWFPGPASDFLARSEVSPAHRHPAHRHPGPRDPGPRDGAE